MLKAKQSWGSIQDATGCSRATIAKIAKRITRHRWRCTGKAGSNRLSISKRERNICKLADKAARTVVLLTERLDHHRGRGQQQITVWAGNLRHLDSIRNSREARREIPKYGNPTPGVRLELLPDSALNPGRRERNFWMQRHGTKNRRANARVLAETKIHEVSGQKSRRNALFGVVSDICGLRGLGGGGSQLRTVSELLGLLIL